MMVTNVVGMLGPYYLSSTAYDEIWQWIRLPQHICDPCLLSIIGPTKSGKSVLLNQVIPGLIAHNYQIKRISAPIIINHTFNLSASPHDAMFELATTIFNSAMALGLLLTAPTREDAMVEVEHLIPEFAAALHRNGKTLYLMLDESQVRQLFNVGLFSCCCTCALYMF